MAIIIDLFSREILAIDPIETGVEVSSDWYSQVVERIEARFGNDLPSHFKSVMGESARRGAPSPYMHGCSFNLQYSHMKRARSKVFNAPHPIPCEVSPSVSVLKPSAEHGDPLPWMDLKYRTAWHHIRMRRGKRLKIVTRSDLVAHDEYIAVLDKSKHSIEIVLSKLNEGLTRIKEPGAPSNARRIAAYEKLKSLGFNVVLKNSIVVAA